MAHVANRTIAGRNSVNSNPRVKRARRLLALSAAALAACLAPRASVAADGTWVLPPVNGNWSDTNKWTGGTIADGAGFTANFIQNITADTTVTLDSSRSIGSVRSQDTTTGFFNWFINSSGGSILTLNNNAAQPIIEVLNQTLVLDTNIAGTNGFRKISAGGLLINSANSGLSGNVRLERSDVRLRNNTALGTSTIVIDPGSSVNARLLLETGLTALANNIIINTSNAGAGVNGSIFSNVAIDMTLSGSVTINGVALSGGHIAGATGTNYLTFSGPITNTLAANFVSGGAGNGIVIRNGNTRMSGGGSYFRIDNRAGTMAVGANNGVATNAIVNLGGNGNGILDLAGFNQSLVAVTKLIGTNANVITNSSTTSASTLTLTPNASNYAISQYTNLAFDGLISDANAAAPLSIVINGDATGLQTLSGAANTYRGTTTVTSGTLAVATLAAGGANSSIGASSNAATNLVLDGGTLRYTGATSSTDRSFTITAAKTGTIEVSNAAATLTVSGGSAATSGSLAKAGLGTLLLSGTNAHTGSTSVNTGSLIVNGSLGIAGSPLTVASGATLGGTGTIASSVTPSAGGIIAPGSGGVGTLTVGALTLNTGSISNLEFGAGNDQITVSNSGGLIANGGSINLYNTGGTTGFATNGNYTLFNITGAVGGSLDNLAIANPTAGKLYTLTNGGAVVTLTIGDGVTRVWDNGAGTNVWTDGGPGGNWSGSAFPNGVGQTASFGAQIGANGNVDLNGSKTVSGLIFNNAGVSYNLTGAGSLTLDNGAAATAITVSSGTHTISVPTVLAGPTAFSTVAAADALTVAGDMTGASSITMAGPGSLNLTGTNGFTTLSINGSTVNVGAGGATGTLGSGGVTLVANAILNFNRSNAYSFAGGITGAGSVNQIGAGTTTVAGAITGVTTVNVSGGALVASAGVNQSGGVNVTNGASLTVSGGVSGAGAMNVNTTGTVLLNGASTYTGATTLTAGTLALGAASSLPANAVLAVNGGTLDLNGNNLSLSNILDVVTSTGVITNNGPAGSVSTISFAGFQANYEMYAALNDGAGGGKVALVSNIGNTASGQNYALRLHRAGTYSGGTTIAAQSITAEVSNALGTGPVTILENNLSINSARLQLLGNVTLPNDVTIVKGNPSGIGVAAFGAITYVPSSTGSSTLTGTISVLNDNITGGTFSGPAIASTDVLNLNGPINASPGVTNISVIHGRVGFGGGGSYPLLNVSGRALVNAPNGIASGAVVNLNGGTLDLTGNNQSLAGLTSTAGTGGTATNTSVTAANLTINNPTSPVSYDGVVGGNLSLVKSGSATFTLTGANTYSGNTVIHAGTLRLAAGNVPVPIASYSFDDGTATNGGTGGAALDGAVLGADLSQAGKFGNGATYTGAGESIDIASGITNLSPTSKWTVAGWVKTAQAGATILSKNTGGGWVGGNSVFYLSNGLNPGGAGGKASAVRNGGGWVTGTTNVNDNTWRFVTYTSDGTVRRIYVDGVLDTLTQTAFNIADTGNTVQLGYTSDTTPADGTAFLNGALDEVKFYDAGLTAAQVLKLFQTNGLGAEDLPNVLPVATAVNIDTAGGALDIGGVSQFIGSLTGVTGTSVILGPGTLKTGDASNTSFAGVISGTGGVTKQGTGTFTVTGANTYTGDTIVNAGTMTLATGGSLASTTLTANTTATLNLNGAVPAAAAINANGGTVTFAGNPGIGAFTRTVGAVTVGSAGLVKINASAFPFTPAILTVASASFADATAKLDLTNNELIIKTTTLSAVVPKITGGNLITTSSGGLLGTLQLGPDVEVRFTLGGDTNLDGKVDVADLGNLATAYGATSGAIWAQGDSNYDGNVDVGDLGTLATSYGNQLAAGPSAGEGDGGLTASSLATVASGSAAVPEPTSLGLLALGATSLLARRRRVR